MQNYRLGMTYQFPQYHPDYILWYLTGVSRLIGVLEIVSEPYSIVNR